ncbi:hypothetical protein CKO51_21575 [Rhodopirellula sp. SM50]|nr:hypothetical protein [Rhodopirellula sp. SM50]PAY17374.1 hypothetical protein CKO51_21575 [Rhodopirellula sp. SM50]
MKKLVLLSATLTILIVLASGLTGAPLKDTDTPTDESAKPTPTCCKDNAAESETAPNTDGKPACCLAAKDAGSVLAKADAENASQCTDCLKPNAKGGCGKCAAAADETDEAAVAKKVAGKGCPFCNEDECKQQCKDCVAAETDAKAAAKQATAVEKGTAMRGGPGMGRGAGKGRGAGMGHGHDAQHDIDHEDFFFLIEHKETIRRTVKNLPNGIETLTESNDEDVAARIQKHVESMYDRMENVNPIRMRDPLFREIFANAKKIKMDVEHTEHGVLVRETSEDAYVAKLLQEHAKVVSLFIKNGYSELPKNHAPPKR